MKILYSVIVHKMLHSYRDTEQSSVAVGTQPTKQTIN